MSLLRYLPLMWAVVGIATAIVWRIGLLPGIGAALPLSIVPVVWFFRHLPEDRQYVTDYAGPTKLVAVLWSLATIGHLVSV
jgi:hypothetical protein